MTAATGDQVVAALRAICPVVTEPAALHAWTTDWSPLAAERPRIDAAPPVAAAVPYTSDEVVAVLRVADAHGRPVLVRGGGSNQAGLLEPCPGGILLLTPALNVIDYVDEVNLTIDVDAGVVGTELVERLAELDFEIGFDIGSMGISTVGGWYATRAQSIASGPGSTIDDLIVAVRLASAKGGLRWLDATVERDRAAGDPACDSHAAEAVVQLRCRVRPKQRTDVRAVIAERELALSTLHDLAGAEALPPSMRVIDPGLAREFDPPARLAPSSVVVLSAAPAGSAAAAALASIADPTNERVADDIASAWHESRHDPTPSIPSALPGRIDEMLDFGVTWSLLAGVIAAAEQPSFHEIVLGWVIERADADGVVVLIRIGIDAVDEVEALAWHEHAVGALIDDMVAAGAKPGRRGVTTRAWHIQSGGVDRFC